MNSHLNFFLEKGTLSEDVSFQLPITILFDSIWMRDQALDLCLRIFETLHELPQSHFGFVSFDSIFQMRESGLEGGTFSETRLLIVAMEAHWGLPEEIEKWIRGWMQSVGTKMHALVGLVHTPVSAEGLSALESLCRGNDTPFFGQALSGKSAGLNEGGVRAFWQTKGESESEVEHGEYGINEW